jgi:iduronate 2-sulfatase
MKTAMFLTRFFLFLYVSFNFVSCEHPIKVESKQPNILFISIDDLRPDLGCYGNTEIFTPNIDAFANTATLMTNTYCQAAVCAPSRASLMTGLRPDSNHVWHLGDKFRDINPKVVTMPQYLHKAGYYTVNIGKIFHNYMPDSVSWDEPDLKPKPYDGSEYDFRDAETIYHTAEAKQKQLERRKEIMARVPAGKRIYGDGWYSGPAYEIADLPDSVFYDGLQTKLALETIKRVKDKDQPFFMGLGFFRPHLPFVAPKKYWDMYPKGSLTPASNNYLPENIPVMSTNANYELRNYVYYRDVGRPEDEPLNADTSDVLKRGYYACVSYIDACIGQLIQGLKEMGVYDNTIIVIWGDHGWKLGEHNGWGKQTNFHIDTHVPLLFRYPGQEKPVRSNALTELIDMFPTLCDLAGVPKADYFQGTSMTPLIEQPNQVWKSAAFSQFRRRSRISKDGNEYMGYSMQTDTHHYIAWYEWDNVSKQKGALKARELYDHTIDLDENTNIASYPEHKNLVADLHKQLQAGWQAALPN